MKNLPVPVLSNINFLSAIVYLYTLVLMQVDILFVRPGERDGDRGDVRRGGHGRGRHYWLSRVHGQSSIGFTFFEAQRMEGKSNHNLMLAIKNGMIVS